MGESWCAFVFWQRGDFHTSDTDWSGENWQGGILTSVQPPCLYIDWNSVSPRWIACILIHVWSAWRNPFTTLIPTAYFSLYTLRQKKKTPHSRKLQESILLMLCYLAGPIKILLYFNRDTFMYTEIPPKNKKNNNIYYTVLYTRVQAEIHGYNRNFYCNFLPSIFLCLAVLKSRWQMTFCQQ